MKLNFGMFHVYVSLRIHITVTHKLSQSLIGTFSGTYLFCIFLLYTKKISKQKGKKVLDAFKHVNSTKYYIRRSSESSGETTT